MTGVTDILTLSALLRLRGRRAQAADRFDALLGV